MTVNAPDDASVMNDNETLIQDIGLLALLSVLGYLGLVLVRPGLPKPDGSTERTSAPTRLFALPTALAGLVS